MIDPALAHSFARDVALMHYVGMRPIIVHGGGPQISELMHKLDQQPQSIDGYRVTGAEELDIVRMVLQKTNKELVAMLNAHGDLAVGVSGEDANLIRARRMTGTRRSRPRVRRRDRPRRSSRASRAAESGFIPVVAPMGLDRDGQVHTSTPTTSPRRSRRSSRRPSLCSSPTSRGTRTSATRVRSCPRYGEASWEMSRREQLSPG